MKKYRTSSHSRYDLKYHFVWITKYRKPRLVDAVGHRLRELVREVCRSNARTQQQMLEIGFDVQGFENVASDAILAPEVVALKNRVPFAKLVRQFTPRFPRHSQPNNGIHKSMIVLTCPTRVFLFIRQISSNLLPTAHLSVRVIAASHSSQNKTECGLLHNIKHQFQSREFYGF